jgi:pimeloyl-ACP methyl ester carboxylesterase
MTRGLKFACIVLMSVGSPVAAQADRYEIGRKLIAFEKAFDLQQNSEARRRAAPGLQKAFSSFMSGRLGDVGRVLDDALWALNDQPPTETARWAATLLVRPSHRLIDPTKHSWTISVQRLYDPKVPTPANAKIRLSLLKPDGQKMSPAVEGPLTEIPAEFSFKELPSESGEWTLRGEVFCDDQIVTTIDHAVSLAVDLRGRLDNLRGAIEKLPETGLTTEQLTLRAHAKLLENLAKGAVMETAYPGERLLREAESLAKLPSDGRYFDGQRVGQFWMTLATPRPAAVRLQVPESAAKGQPLPLVIALHGAGGSENMFFDAYGHGEVARQCAKRGWLLVATRTEFLAAPPVADVVDELAKRYPVDKSKVFLVGHSMGAGQALAAARQYPDRWAGVAALGGGGRMSPTDAMKKLPFFVGCGTEDFAIRGAKSTAKSLIEAGVETVEFRDYPDIEHIAIVQVALPDVFQWYDRLMTNK